MAKQQPLFQPTFSWLLKNPIRFLGFGFGTGLSPKAPGTIGTLPALPLAWLFLSFGFHPLGLVILSLVLFFIGIAICNITERDLGVHDYGGIVWDEIVAMLLILAFVPQTVFWWLLAFLLFRFFDALKPPPIKWFDSKVQGGFGVMLDDIIAAFMSIVILLMTQWMI